MREGRNINHLEIRNGDPFAVGFAPPKSLKNAFQTAADQFKFGGSASAGSRAVIAVEHAYLDLQAALETIGSELHEDEVLWGDETSLYKPQLEDGLPARLGDAFMELAERKEYDDAMPSMTKTAAGIWLGYRDHLAALSILQLDRTAIALARGDADAAVWLLCDHYYLGLQMASEDLMCHVDDLLTAPNQAARDYGRRGGALRHERTNALKAWALREAASMKSADIEMARTLAQQIPSSMLNASRDPERLIYEALRNRRNQGGLDGS